MITELMIVLIVVGSIMVFVVWNNSRQRRQQAEDQRIVMESTAKMKEELERTASEVIQRMETQATNLENLLEDADRNRTEFEGRLAELKKVIKHGESQATEIKSLLQKLSDAGENVEDLQRKLDAIELKISTRLTMPMQVPMPMIQQVPSPISPPPMMRQPTYPQQPIPQQAIPQPSVPPPVQPAPIVEPIVEPPVEEPSNEARDFAAVLQRSMAEAQEAALSKRAKPIPDRPSIVLPSTDKKSNVVAGRPVKIETRTTQATDTRSTPRTSTPRTSTPRSSTPTAQRQQAPRGAQQPTPQRAQQAAPQRAAQQPTPQRSTIAPQAAAALNAPNAIKIKNMLLEGKTVEDIARELGMGRGAVELVQEMTRRLLDRRKAP